MKPLTDTDSFFLEGEWMMGVDLARPGSEKTVLVTVPAAEVTKGRGVTRRPMVADEVEALRCVGEQVGFSPGTWDKKFARELYARSMASEQISDKEAAQVWRLFKRYRRQITHAEKERLLRVAEMRAAPEWRSGKAGK